VAPAPASPITVEQPNGFKAQATGAFGPFGATLGFARDDQNTSITFGPAEGFGFFGGVGQGKAASENSAQASVMGGLGPAGVSLTAGTSGVTGTFTTTEEMNPGLNQTQTNSLTYGNDGKLTASQTEGYGFGNAGIVSTYTFTFSISNQTLDAIGSALNRALGPSTPSEPGSEIGGPIPTD
jgi:hypothetical protein